VHNLNIQNFESRHIYGHKSYGVKKGRQAGGISVYFKTALKDKISIVKVNDYGIIWFKLDSKMLILIKMFTFVVLTFHHLVQKS